MRVRSALHRDARDLTLAQQVQNIIRRQSLAFNGVWYDPSDLSTLFQDAAGTIPVTEVGQPVGRLLDKSGLGNHATQSTAGYKPLYQVENGRGYLAFDGLDDFLVTGNVDFSASDKIAVAAGIRKLSDAADGELVMLSGGTANNGIFDLRAPGSATATKFQCLFRGTNSAIPFTSSAAYSAPLSCVVSATSVISQDVAQLRVNSVQVGSRSSDLGTGNFGNYPLYIGRLSGTTLPFNGRLYGLAICGGLDDIYKLKKIEQYLARKTGVII